MPALNPRLRRSSLMTRHIHRIAALATAGLAVAGLAACSSSGAGPGGASNANKPVFGGTLRIVAASGPDHLDTVPAYYTADYILEKAYTRQLLAYPTVPDPPFTSARPVECDAYVPNSLQLDQHTISLGPYQITSYTPNKSMTMEKNPAWKQSTDSVRHQYVSKITMTMGVTSAATQLADMQAGKTGT